MQLEVNIVDAFTDTVFKGNSAAVITTDNWLSDGLMQLIAMENNLPATAFLVQESGNTDTYHIRWFSPLTEIDFCGHATLASAFVLFNKYPDLTHIQFFAKAVGVLSVIQNDDGKIQMDFPNTKPYKVHSIPKALTDGLSIAPVAVYKNTQAYFVVYPIESDVLNIVVDNERLKSLQPPKLVVSCLPKSELFDEYDFISRCFILSDATEDSVTGSSHTGLAPLWAERLGKNELVAYQASARGGVLDCEVAGDRVLISGHAVPYLTGCITVEE